MTSIGYNWYFGRVIKYLRHKKGLSQGEYADRVGKIQSAISKIETGRQGVPAKDLAAFAQPLGILSTDLQELVSHCFATYKSSDTCAERNKRIRKLCDAKLGL